MSNRLRCHLDPSFSLLLSPFAGRWPSTVTHRSTTNSEQSPRTGEQGSRFGWCAVPRGGASANTPQKRETVTTASTRWEPGVPEVGESWWGELCIGDIGLDLDVKYFDWWTTMLPFDRQTCAGAYRLFWWPTSLEETISCEMENWK